MSERRRNRNVILGLCAFFLTGCGNTEDVEREYFDPAPLPGCEELDYAVCDVRDPACQKSLFECAACLRGDDAGKLPPIDYLTREEYRAMLEADAAGAEFPEPNHTEVTLHFLGLVEAGAFSRDKSLEFSANFPVGVYRSDQKRILLIEIDPAEKITPDSAIANVTLLHEFVHALQDRTASFPALYEAQPATVDAFLGLRSLVEGEARLLELFMMAALNGVSMEKIDWPLAFEGRIARAETALSEAPSPLLASLGIFPYDYGGLFIYHVREQKGQDGVRALFKAPPTSTLPALRSAEELPEIKVTPIAFEAPAAPEGVTLDNDTALGPWGVWLALYAHGRSREEARELALAWRGDHIFSYAGPEATTTMIWELTFADDSAAERVASALVLPSDIEWDVQRQGPRVHLRATNAVGTLKDWPPISP
jgi:hypothetical protein